MSINDGFGNILIGRAGIGMTTGVSVYIGYGCRKYS